MIGIYGGRETGSASTSILLLLDKSKGALGELSAAQGESSRAFLGRERTAYLQFYQVEQATLTARPVI